MITPSYRTIRSYFLSALTAVALWCGIKYGLALPNYMLPSPAEVTAVLIQKQHVLFHHAIITATEAILGLSLAVLVGFGSGVALFNFQSLSRIVFPIFSGSQAIPIIATAPLFMLWFGPGLMSKILLAAVLCYFPILIVTLKGLGQYTGSIIDVMRVQGASTREIFMLAILPGSVPSIMNGVRTSAAMAFMGAIVAEYSGASEGLGYLIIQATYRTDTPLLFAALVLAIVFSIGLIGLVELCDRAFLRKYTQQK